MWPLLTTSSPARVLTPRLLFNLALGRPFHCHIREILSSVSLSCDVSRVNTGAHLYPDPGCAAQKSLFFLSLPLTHFLSSSFSFRLRWTVSSTNNKLVPVFSSGITCRRRISTVTFYRFLRSPPPAFHGENC